MKETQMPPARAANLVANSDNTVYGVESIGDIIFRWSYSLVCTLHYLRIITMQTYLQALNIGLRLSQLSHLSYM